MEKAKNITSKASKRCMAVSLVLMGSAGLSACQDSEVDSFVYGSVAECMQNGVYDQAKCEGDHKQALAAHIETAPAYNRREDCEAEFGVGKCEENTAFATAGSGEAGQQQVQGSMGGSFFMPMMMGYMMGSMFANGKQMAPQALYRQNGQSSYVNANGARVAAASGPVKFKSSAAAVQAPKARTTTLARGGFGARATAASS